MSGQVRGGKRWIGLVSGRSFAARCSLRVRSRGWIPVVPVLQNSQLKWYLPPISLLWAPVLHYVCAYQLTMLAWRCYHVSKVVTMFSVIMCSL